MKRCEKGEYGYLSQRKWSQLLLAVLMGVIGLSIYMVGFFVNGMKQNDVCLVLGILMVLPGAKFLSTFILLAPYQEPEREQYEKIQKAAKKNKKDGVLLSGLVITSEKKPMNLDYLYLESGYVYGISSSKRNSGKEAKEYLTIGVRKYSAGYTVQVFEEFHRFERAVLDTKKKGISKNEEESVRAFLYSLIV